MGGCALWLYMRTHVACDKPSWMPNDADVYLFGHGCRGEEYKDSILGCGCKHSNGAWEMPSCFHPDRNGYQTLVFLKACLAAVHELRKCGFDAVIDVPPNRAQGRQLNQIAAYRSDNFDEGRLGPFAALTGFNGENGTNGRQRTHALLARRTPAYYAASETSESYEKVLKAYVHHAEERRNAANAWIIGSRHPPPHDLRKPPEETYTALGPAVVVPLNRSEIPNSTVPESSWVGVTPPPAMEGISYSPAHRRFFLINISVPDAPGPFRQMQFMGGRDWIIDDVSSQSCRRKAVRESFDISVCQLSISPDQHGYRFCASEQVKQDVHLCHMRTLQSYPKTEQRVAKYAARGFTLCGEVNP